MDILCLSFPIRHCPLSPSLVGWHVGCEVVTTSDRWKGKDSATADVPPATQCTETGTLSVPLRQLTVGVITPTFVIYEREVTIFLFDALIKKY